MKQMRQGWETPTVSCLPEPPELLTKAFGVQKPSAFFTGASSGQTTQQALSRLVFPQEWNLPWKETEEGLRSLESVYTGASCSRGVRVQLADKLPPHDGVPALLTRRRSLLCSTWTALPSLPGHPLFLEAFLNLSGALICRSPPKLSSPVQAKDKKTQREKDTWREINTVWRAFKKNTINAAALF